MERESMAYDVVIVGAGPAGLSTAIKLAQLAQAKQQEISICIVEKGSEVGAHILSGAILEPRALDELLPDWQETKNFSTTAVTDDEFIYLTETKAKRLPTPPSMKNHGNYIISLGNLCRFLGEQAEQLGVEIYPGFCASDIHYDEQGHVNGIITGDLGITKEGEQGPQYQPGMLLQAKQTVFAEGCRGSLSQRLMEQFNLRDGVSPQTYGLGIKELWEVDASVHEPGKVLHTIGWPLDKQTYGGSFIYHLKDDNKLAVGFVVGLDYQNPYLSPFQEMQRFKTHPAIAPLFENGKRIAYGARALNEGGYQSVPKLSFPGGLIVGCAAGFLNVAKIKGTHTAMKTGMLAAESIFQHLTQDDTPSGQELTTFNQQVKQSWVMKELYKVRNIRPSFRWGLWPALVYSALDTYVLRGKAPWTLQHHADHTSLKLASESTKIAYPKPDNKISFDRLSSVYLSGANHEENQPAHLKLKDSHLAIDVNYNLYHSPEQYYCPAGVYEIVQAEGQPRLQINAANCVHCKTCDIKDPKQNIQWTTPEGGGGPNYPDM